jgi:hypothetical protein
MGALNPGSAGRVPALPRSYRVLLKVSRSIAAKSAQYFHPSMPHRAPEPTQPQRNAPACRRGSSTRSAERPDPSLRDESDSGERPLRTYQRAEMSPVLGHPLCMESSRGIDRASGVRYQAEAIARAARRRRHPQCRLAWKAEVRPERPDRHEPVISAADDAQWILALRSPP